MLKVLLFLSFLVAYGLWTVLCARTLKKVQSDLLVGKSFWSSEFMLLEGVVGFFGFIYLLSGLWSTKLVLLIFVVSHLGGLVSWFLSSILGAQSEKTGIRALSAGKEIDIKYPVPMLVLGVSCSLMVLAYPVVAGILFFRHTWKTSVLQLLEVKYSLLLLNLSGYVLLVIVTSLMLASENLDEETRQRVFINQLGGLIPAAIYVGLAFWAFGLGTNSLPVDVMGIPARTLSLPTLGLLLVFFVLTVLLPYMIGAQRSVRRSRELPKKIRDLVSEMAAILESPAASSYIVKLSALRDKITRYREEFTAGDKWLVYDDQIRQLGDKVPEKDKPLADAIQKTRDIDPRFKFLDDLGKLQSEIEEIIADLQTRSPETILAAAHDWSKDYVFRRDELSETIKDAASRKPLITGAVGSLAMLIVSGLLSEVTKMAWQWISHPSK